MTRMSWDEYFMQISELVSKRSTCLRRKVGAVMVKDKTIISTGYNGAPKKTKHCLEAGCLRQELNVPSGEKHELCRGTHAEQNAIAQAAAKGISTEGSTIYCNTFPCIICLKLLINAGIKEVVYVKAYGDELTKKEVEKMISDSGIVVRQLKLHL